MTASNSVDKIVRDAVFSRLQSWRSRSSLHFLNNQRLFMLRDYLNLLSRSLRRLDIRRIFVGGEILLPIHGRHTIIEFLLVPTVVRLAFTAILVIAGAVGEVVIVAAITP